MYKLRTFLGLALLSISVAAQAITIVQMQTRLGTDVSDIYLELFDATAPKNVNNFLGYVTRGDYDNSFIHRKVQTSSGDPFVVQGGGFTYVPQYDFDNPVQKAAFGTTTLIPYGNQTTGELGVRPIGETYYIDKNYDDVPDVDGTGATIVRTNSGLQQIPIDTTDLPVNSEANLSNLRGTIAMALSQNPDGTSSPDSATDQWFVNLRDNTQLDPGSGNFTVFGKVLGNGMNFFDAVNNLGTYPIAASAINPQFGDLPAINYSLGTVLLDENLVKITSAREVMTLDTTDHDFLYVPVGSTAQVTITITTSMAWASDLVVSMVGDLQKLSPPFSETNNCTGASVSVPPGNSCTITITFAPTSQDTYQTGLDLAFSSPGIPNLPITLEATSQNSPKVVSSTGNTLDFNYVYPGIPKTKTVVITNPGQQPLIINGINVDNTTNFSTTGNCIGATLAYKGTCTIDVSMSVGSEGPQSGVLTIASNDPVTPSFTINMSGTGSYTTTPKIDMVSNYDFGDLKNGTKSTQLISVTNTGTAELIISSLSIGGADASDFALNNNNCITTIAAGASCDISVAYSPQSLGVKAAQLTVSSNDPATQSLTIALTATSSSDYDGIPDTEEDASPNSGDNNSDGSKDSLESNVVSMLTASGEYMTLATINKIGFAKVSLVSNPSPSDTPAGTSFTNGFVSYQLGYIPGTSPFQVGIILPLDQHPDAFYQYGPTQDNPTPHWYNFAYNGQTGAQIFYNAKLYAPDGTFITRNFIQVWYIDGQRGDDDMVANGVISNTSAASIAPSTSSSGGLNYAFTILCIVVIGFLRLLEDSRRHCYRG